MFKKAYCGYIKDNEKLIASASGGLATAMSEQILRSNGVVYGVSYFPPGNFKDVAYIRVSSLDDLNLLKGSKYIKANLTKELMDLVVNDIKSGVTVLFIGLPCDVRAIRNYIKKEGESDNNLLSVDLICRGPTSSLVAEKYIDYLERRYKSKVVEFNVRYKNPYWKPPYLYARFANNKKFIWPFFETAYGVAFIMMPEKKCYTCKNKGDNHFSDVTIDDFWGSTENTLGYNQYGSSIALVNTEKGDCFITSLADFELFSVNAEKILESNSRFNQNIESTPETREFKKNYDEKGLFYATFRRWKLRKTLLITIRRIMAKFKF